MYAHCCYRLAKSGAILALSFGTNVQASSNKSMLDFTKNLKKFQDVAKSPKPLETKAPVSGCQGKVTRSIFKLIDKSPAMSLRPQILKQIPTINVKAKVVAHENRTASTLATNDGHPPHQGQSPTHQTEGTELFVEQKEPEIEQQVPDGSGTPIEAAPQLEDVVTNQEPPAKRSDSCSEQKDQEVDVPSKKQDLGSMSVDELSAPQQKVERRVPPPPPARKTKPIVDITDVKFSHVSARKRGKLEAQGLSLQARSDGFLHFTRPRNQPIDRIPKEIKQKQRKSRQHGRKSKPDANAMGVRNFLQAQATLDAKHGRNDAIPALDEGPAACSDQDDEKVAAFPIGTEIYANQGLTDGHGPRSNRMSNFPLIFLGHGVRDEKTYLFFKKGNKTVACMIDPANPKPIFETRDNKETLKMYGKDFRTIENDQSPSGNVEFYFFNNNAGPMIKSYIVNAKDGFPAEDKYN